jgi:hypothetical protein
MKSRFIIATLLIAILGICPRINAQYAFGGYQDGTLGSGGDEKLTGISDLNSDIENMVKCYPNPFRGNTNIEIKLTESNNVSVEVYNINNILVKTLVDNESLDKGLHYISWDGSNEMSFKLNAGVYYYKIRIDKKVLSRRIVLLK